jgi:hypothetical protein
MNLSRFMHCGLKKSMCVAAKGRLQGRAATLLLLWAGFYFFFFVFMQQKFHSHFVVVFFLRLVANGWLGDGKPIAKHWFAVA